MQREAEALRPEMNSNSILCYGEVLWDMLPAGPALGGAPLNLAFRLHSLGQRVRMVCAAP